MSYGTNVGIFFCSNALIALARSLCKCLLAMLITASGADAVTGYLVRCACIDNTIPWQETENQQPTKHRNKNTQTKQTPRTPNPKNENRTSQLGMVYPKAAMRLNDKAACVPSPERVIHETTAQGKNLTRWPGGAKQKKSWCRNPGCPQPGSRRSHHKAVPADKHRCTSIASISRAVWKTWWWN